MPCNHVGRTRIGEQTRDERAKARHFFGRIRQPGDKKSAFHCVIRGIGRLKIFTIIKKRNSTINCLIQIISIHYFQIHNTGLPLNHLFLWEKWVPLDFLSSVLQKLFSNGASELIVALSSTNATKPNSCTFKSRVMFLSYAKHWPKSFCSGQPAETPQDGLSRYL